MTSLWGQEQHIITGYVVDLETGDPVPYASVGVLEQQRGISANINGYFRLLLAENNPDHHLQISSIGYKRMTISLADISWGDEQRFQLTPELTVLDEIVILGKSQTLEQLVKNVSKNRKRYLRSRPYLMDGFYREVLKLDGSYRGLTEAQGILYLNGYDARYKNNRNHMTFDLAQWKHIRRSNYPEDETNYLEISTLLKTKDYFLHDGPLDKPILDKMDFKVTDSTTYQDRLVLEISFTPKKDHVHQIPYEGSMLVKEDDQALLSLDIVMKGPEPYLRDTDDKRDITTSFEISFMQFDGQYYLNHVSLSRSYMSGNKEVNWFTELVGSAFTNQQAMYLSYNQRAVLYSEMLNPMVNYDHDFWESFSFSNGTDFQNMAAEDPGLTSQFESHDQLRLLPLPKGYKSYEQMSNDRDAMDFIMQR
jgi:hypothetical protein